MTWRFREIENIGIVTCMLVLGVIEQDIWANLLPFWRHIGNQYGGNHGSRVVGVYFVMILRYHRTLVQRFMLLQSTFK